MMNVSSQIGCCGMREISGLSGYKKPEEALKGFIASTLSNGSYARFRYVAFSEAKSSYNEDYGVCFAAFIRKNKLGKVAGTSWNVNPNSGNRLKAWLWTVDWDALKAWQAKNVKKTRGKKAETPVAGADVAAVLNPAPVPAQ